MPLLLLVDLALAAFMAGVGWLVEAVVYPQFRQVGAERFAAYHREHATRITPVVVGPMVLAPLVAAALLLDPPAGAPGALLVLNLLLPAGLLAVTGLVFGPLHTRLGGEGPDEALLRRLAHLNRLRTVAWTAHLAVALALAAAAT